MPDSSTAPLSEWGLAEEFLRQHPTRWGSLNWIAARPLIASVNHILSTGAGNIVAELRNHYIDRSPNPSLVIDAPDISTFVIIGDTGEGDASQYVVAPALSRAVRASRAGFVVIMSDVIYPSGDINDYVDAVYRPYRSRDNDQFSVYAPLLGLPGNHDWYGSLFGFMYHFCGQDKPAPEIYAPTTGSLVERLCRILWRRPSSPTTAAAAARADTPAVGPAMTQPGPYYAIRTRDVLVVTIDTGIDGSIDPRQMAWLENLSRLYPGPKLLVTGSPLLVNANIEPCRVLPETPGLTASVWDLVNNPANNYVATVGGDVHNFQRYLANQPSPGLPQVHLVSGGGGAFMHAMHPIDLAVGDSRVDLTASHPYPDLMFPTTHESFSFFAKQIVPSIWRILRALAIFVLGTLTTTAAAGLGGIIASPPTLVRWLGFGAIGGLALVIALRMTLRRLGRSSGLKRALVPIGAYGMGIVAASAAYQLDPRHYFAYLGLWLIATAWHVLFDLAISRSGWWLPELDHPAEREVGPVAFFLGLGLACLIAFGLEAWFFRTPAQLALAAVSVLLLFAVGLSGRIIRRHPRASAWWRRRGTLVAIITQMLFFATVVCELAITEGLLEEFFGGLLGIVVFIAMLLLTAVLLVAITELCTLPARIGHGNVRLAWSHAAQVMHQVPLAFMAAEIAVWCLLTNSPLTDSAISFPLVMTVLVSSLIFVDVTRRVLPNAYKPITFGVFVLLAVGGYLWAGWPVLFGLGAAVITTAIVVSVLLAHLVFLGAHTIVFDTAAHQGNVSFTEEQLAEIFAAKIQQPRPRVPNVPVTVRRWARLTYPGVGEPGGPLQRQVAEIYSTDVPPFFKGFLQVDTSPGAMSVTLHKVFGDRPSEAVVVANVALR